MNDEYRDEANRPDPDRMEELAARARELAERAEEMSRQAAAAAGSEHELAELERELADLDAEERKLDAEFTALLDEDAANADERAHDALDGDDAARTREERLTSWADRLTEHMDTLGDRLTDAFNAAFSSGSFVGFASGGRRVDTVEREVAVGGPLPVTVENAAGKVVVRPADGDKVRVVAERRGAAVAERDDWAVEVAFDDDGVRVTCEAPRNSNLVPGWVNLDVSVPRTSTVDARTSGGSVVVDRVGGPVTASTKGGSIRVDGAVGRADLDTLGGSIVVSDHDGPVHARTLGGSLKLTGRLTDEVTADTAGGSISILGVDGVVRAKTSGGSVRVSGRFRGDSSLETRGGSVSAKLEPDSNVRVEGRGSSASSDFAALRASKGRIEGTLGDGSDGTLTLRTTAGSVRVSSL